MANVQTLKAMCAVLQHFGKKGYDAMLDNAKSDAKLLSTEGINVTTDEILTINVFLNFELLLSEKLTGVAENFNCHFELNPNQTTKTAKFYIMGQEFQGNSQALIKRIELLQDLDMAYLEPAGAWDC